MSTEVTAMPGIPSENLETVPPSDVFTIHYRKGNDILSFNFYHRKREATWTANEQFRDAVERAKLHCERMRYRFLFCRPYIQDLEELERRMAL